ncbi:uncharacterized protein LOC122790982 isoform X2 [Protopterus annectens]|uniref:uncharacterized protein LOC122790982 isoform X2 n=1 Tax=Protopterus annectens TaxID=7888 RepID=UPI001CF93CBC|nr:uncharacterized protein LOC122790982 isoform X2 [Protopterus annectens]
MKQKHTKDTINLASTCTSESEQEYEMKLELNKDEDLYVTAKVISTRVNHSEGYGTEDGLTDCEMRHSFTEDESDVDADVEDTESRGTLATQRRKANFTEEENAVLLNAIKADGALLMGHGQNHEEQQFRWSEVAAEVNAVGGHNRDVPECRQRVVNMRYRAKAKVCKTILLEQARREMRMLAAPTLTEDDIMLLSLLPCPAYNIGDGCSCTRSRLKNTETLQRTCLKRKRKHKLIKQDTTESEEDVGQRTAPRRWNLHLSPCKAIQNVKEESISQMRPLLLKGYKKAAAKQPCKKLQDIEKSYPFTLLKFSTIPLLFALFLIPIGVVLMMYIL